MNYIDAFKTGLKPDEDLTLLDWADKYFYLPRESSAEYGKYRSERTPMVREILLELSPSCPTQEVVVMKPTQLAGTTAAIIFMLGSADIAPGPGLCIQPTAELAKSFSKKKFQTSVNATTAGSGRLAGKIKDAKSRDGDNTILEKTFPGGSWRLAGSNSPAVYRSESVRYIILDDFDGFESNIGGEGDPGELADRRTGTFHNRKIYKNSTPTIKGLCNIERAYEASSQGRFEVPCPHCGRYQYLVFGGAGVDHGIKFSRNTDGEVVDCWYQCEHCQGRIDEHEKEWMLPQGKYVHEYPHRPAKGFKYNALYTPLGWVNSWKRITELFLAAKNNPEKLQTWTNTLMAEAFERKGAQPDWAILSARSEPYPFLSVPDGGVLLTCGCDCHKERLNVVIRAWGAGQESWLVYAGELYGNIEQDNLWNQLDQLLNRQYRHASGFDLNVISCGIDSGDFTQAVYQYCRTRAPRVFPLKGMSTPNKPIIGRPTDQDVSWKGTVIKGGVKLWPIGTDQAKVTIYERLQLTGQGPGVYHWPLDIPDVDTYFLQLTSEKQITKFTKGYPKSEWIMMRDNHFLDAEVYCYAAALKAGLARMDLSKIQEQLKTQKTETPNQQSKPQQRPPAPRKVARSNWMSR